MSGIQIALDGQLHGQPGDPHDAIAQAYRAHGDDCARHLLGEYAFAVRDGDRLLLARDTAGIRPLFFTESAFAWSVPELLAQGVERRVDPVGVVDFLVSRGSLAPSRTCWAGVHRLGAGERAVLSGGEARVSRYWSVSEIPASGGSVEATAAALQEAIRDRTAGSARAGIALSGGWDSGVLFSLWQWMRTRDPGLALPWFYTYYGSAPDEDERAEVRALVERWPADGCFAPLDATAGIAGLDGQIARIGLPETSSGWRWYAAMGAAARRQGIDTLLSGEGGNEVFRASMLQPLELARDGSGAEAMRCVAAWAREIDSSPWRFAWRYVARPALELRVPWLLDALRPEAAPAYLTDSARAIARDLISDAARRRRERYRRGPLAYQERLLNLEAWWNELFPLSSALDLEGVRASAPFLDRRVMTAAIPALLARRQFETTRDLAAAVLRATTGQPFAGRYAHYTKLLEESLAPALHGFEAKALAEVGIVEPARLRAVLAGSPPASRMWPLLSAETWARTSLSGVQYGK